jgi:carbamoyltransferase
MKPNEHEYKVMGLAPYGKSQHALEVLRIFESYQSVDGIKFKDLNMPKDLYFSVKNDLIGHRFDSIASGLQMFSENLIIAWVNNLIEETGIDNIVLSGGVAMNVKVNSMISKLKNVRSLLVPPSPDDSSQSMGAAYASTATLIDKQGKIHFPSNNKPISNAYLGKVYEEDYLHKLAIKFAEKNELLITNDAINEAARMICEGAIIGRFSGGAEFGARALGNRSILADPSNIESVKKINEKIKNRDFWMPFAATIMAEHKDKYIYTDVEEASYFYMTNACNTTPLGSKKLRAAIHPYDGTCRPQILTRIHNPEYWELIKKVGEISGTYALLNTSFNYHGKPIVGDPTDALNLFNDANLDAFLIGILLVFI